MDTMMMVFLNVNHVTILVKLVVLIILAILVLLEELILQNVNAH
jgi:hypothetical protein